MEKELRTRLAQPFPDSYIRQRKGSFGKTLNYLAATRPPIGRQFRKTVLNSCNASHC